MQHHLIRLTQRLFFLVIFAFNSLAIAQSLSANLPPYSQGYDETRNPFDDARAALALAKQTQRNVIIEIGGNWCTWCHRMDDFLAKNPQVFEILQQHYVLLKVNVSDTNNNAEFMQSLPPVLGYPHMFVSTAEGKILVSKDTAELQNEQGYDAKRWLAFLQQWQFSHNAQHLEAIAVSAQSTQATTQGATP
jgi:thioredoxin-related protein